MHSARHVIGRYLTQEMRGQNVFDDLASGIHHPLPPASSLPRSPRCVPASGTPTPPTSAPQGLTPVPFSAQPPDRKPEMGTSGQARDEELAKCVCRYTVSNQLGNKRPGQGRGGGERARAQGGGGCECARVHRYTMSKQSGKGWRRPCLSCTTRNRNWSSLRAMVRTFPFRSASVSSGAGSNVSASSPASSKQGRVPFSPQLNAVGGLRSMFLSLSLLS